MSAPSGGLSHTSATSHGTSSPDGERRAYGQFPLQAKVDEDLSIGCACFLPSHMLGTGDMTADSVLTWQGSRQAINQAIPVREKHPVLEVQRKPGAKGQAGVLEMGNRHRLSYASWSFPSPVTSPTSIRG